MPIKAKNPSESISNRVGDKADQAIANKQYEILSPPDGGYGWVIVFASFMCNVIVDGITFTFGVFLPHFVATFNVGNGSAAWAGSLLAGVSLCVGPLVSALTNKFGCRSVCISGSIVAAAGFALSAGSNSLEVLLITYGVIGGIGFGLIYLPAIVCVGYYFESKRSLATGIAVCGSGVGTFVFAPFAELLLQKMDWRKANLILSGITLLCGIFGFLMKPVKIQTEEKSYVETASISGLSVQSPIILFRKYVWILIGLSTSIHLLPYPPTSQKHLLPPNTPLDPSSSYLFTYSHNNHLSETSDANILRSSETQQINSPHPNPSPDDEDEGCSSSSSSSSGGVKESRCHRSSGPRFTAFKSVLAEMLDFSLLKNPVFLSIVASNIIGTLGVYVPLVYVIDMATQQNVENRKAAFLLSLIGVSNTVGKLLFGLICGRPQVNTLYTNNLFIMLTGFCIVSFPYCEHYYEFLIVSILYGLFVSFNALTSLVLVDQLEPEQLTTSFGILILFCGAASIIGAPVAGLLFDTFQNYEIPFWAAAGVIFTSAAVNFMIPSLQKFAPKYKSSETEEEEEEPPEEIDLIVLPINRVHEYSKVFVFSLFL